MSQMSRPKDHILPASVEALVRNPSQVSASETAILAAELVAAAAMFAVARARLNRQTKRRQLPRITVFLEAPARPASVTRRTASVPQSAFDIVHKTMGLYQRVDWVWLGENSSLICA